MRARVILLVAVLLASCSGGDAELTLGEYVEAFQGIVGDAQADATALFDSPEGAVLVAANEDLSSHHPSELTAALDGIGRIEERAVAAASELHPPEVLEDLHDLFFDDTYAKARVALGTRAATAETWEELSSTPEMAEYRAAVGRDRRVCRDLESILERADVGEAFANTPWVPGELKEVFDAVLGCSAFTPDPDDQFRPPGA